MTARLASARGASIESSFEGRDGDLLLSGLWGFEREALRVDGDGRPAATDHPFPPERRDITVDFAENQIELVTRPAGSIEEALGELRRLHRAAYEGMGEELLWPLSVPGRWDEPERLRPAEFGGLPEMEESRLYRRWLLSRYGRARQAITGLHYNLSFSSGLWDRLRRAEGSRESPPDFANRRYMDLARNFARHRFLPIFLFSASPVLDRRFAAELAASADPSSRAMGRTCLPSTASLRLGPLGYRLGRNTANRIDMRFDSLAEYIGKLEAAVSPAGASPPLLRSEGEFYAPIRPKAAFPGSKASLAALKAKGIEYLELRIFDLDPFDPIGIGAEEAIWIHLFALACLFMPSPRLERGAALDEPLSLAASACSLEGAGRRTVPRLASAVGRAGAEILETMSRLARLLPSEYELALGRSRDILAGRRPRTVERFGRLASEMGGGLAAGLDLARRHRAAVAGVPERLEPREAMKWNS
jgi:glutamate--cysteine ligase